MNIKIIYISYLCFIVSIFLCGCNDDDIEDRITRTITVDITVDSLPATVTVEKPTTPHGNMEYSWGIVFDTSGNHAVGTGDVMLRLYYFRTNGNPEATVTVESLKAKVFLYLTDTQAQSVGTIQANVTGDTITLIAKDNIVSNLRNVTENTDVYFETTYWDHNTSTTYYDYMPTSKTYSAASGDGQYTDPLSDVSFALIDLVQMSVAIE